MGKAYGGFPSNSISAQALQKYKIIDLITGDYFVFHAMPDGGYSFGKQVRWADTEIQGRSSPIKGYNSSDAISFSLRIPLHSSIEQGDSRTPQDVRDGILFFMSLAYPDYQQGVKPPHKCLLLMAAQVTGMTVVPMGCDVEVQGPWDIATGLSHRALVTMSFQEVVDIPWDFKEIRDGVAW